MGLKYKVLKLFVISAILCFPLLGTECSKLLDSTPTTVTGSWDLVKMLGNAQDVCLGERAVFDGNGIATLTCPNSSPVTRAYTYTDDVLTYTSNNLSYTVTFSNVNSVQKMTLTGRNGVDRELTYDLISK
ncbi:MAG: hypothetical protein HY959_07230 [Ignavibacteriae bacterium]|nr:hypothetical protein [Ignavibacteriota bacterium]